MVEFIGYAVGNSPVRKKRGKTAYACIPKSWIAPDIQISLLLARK